MEVEVDIEGDLEENSHISGNEELEIVDPVDSRKIQIRDLKAEIVSIRKTLKTADKKTKKTLQERISSLESQVDTLKQEIEAEEQQNSFMILDKQAKERAERQKQKRDAKMAAEEERRREAAQIAAAMPQLSKMETESVLQRLKSASLLIHDISPDGNCLFNSLSHQLAIRTSTNISQSKLRSMAAEYIFQNAPKYSGFMEEGMEEYCEGIKHGAAWGGHLELDALSHSLQMPISVHQAGSDPLIFGQDEYDSTPSLHILYRKHAYSLGEHYDSLIDQTGDEDLEIVN